MERHGDEVHVNTTDARSGATPHIVRYVLGFSLILAIVAMSAIWIIGAVYSDKQPLTDSPVTQTAPTPAKS